MDDRDTITVTDDEAGVRLDTLMTARYPERSRTYFQQLIKEGLVLLNGEPVKKRTQPEAGDEIEVQFAYTKETSLAPESIPLDILYEDASLIVVNKPSGLVVHPGAGNWTGTLVNGLLHHFQGLSAQDPESLRPGLVHRLDKDTTGVIVIAKEARAHQLLVEQFSGRQVEKAYLAICVGNPVTQKVSGAIGRHPTQRKKFAITETGRAAHSDIEPILHNELLSLVRVYPRTGRTHQIRVHLQSINTPVLGDPLYGSERMNKRYGLDGQMLHAHTLKFTHPVTGQPISIKAPLPETFRKLIREINPAFNLDTL